MVSRWLSTHRWYCGVTDSPDQGCRESLTPRVVIAWSFLEYFGGLLVSTIQGIGDSVYCLYGELPSPCIIGASSRKVWFLVDFESLRRSPHAFKGKIRQKSKCCLPRLLIVGRKYFIKNMFANLKLKFKGCNRYVRDLCPNRIIQKIKKSNSHVSLTSCTQNAASIKVLRVRIWLFGGAA
jgi:hypothetical protein